MRTLFAIDLARDGPGGFAWRNLKTAVAAAGADPRGPSPLGLVTAAGYGFDPAEGPLGPGAMRVEILTPDRSRARAPRELSEGAARCDERSLPAVSLPPARGSERPAFPAHGISLEIGGKWAVVGIEDEEWEAAAGPILLAISVCWRFLEVDHRLDDLAALAASPSGRRAGLAGSIRRIRALGSDLSCCEGSLVDPRGYFPSKAEAALYVKLARGLGLARWRERIGERVEVVEALLDSQVEERRHRDVLALEVGLELLILLALILDIGINLFFSLSGWE